MSSSMDGFTDSQFLELMRDFSERVKCSLSPISFVRAASPNTSPEGETESGSLSVNSEPKKRKKRSTRKHKTSSKKTDRSSKSLRPLGIFDDVGNSTQEITGELTQGNEGFDVLIAQQICDDGKPQMMEDMGSYFLMRHGITYPGPWMAMMSGPMALDIAGYRLSAEAVKKDKYVLVGNYSSNAVDGVWEHFWLKSKGRMIKTHLTLLAGFKTAEQQQMEMMGGGAGPRFPSFITFADIKYPNWSSRFRFDMMTNEMSISFNRKLTDTLSIGAKIGTSYDTRKSYVEFGGRWKFGGSSTSSATDSGSSGGSSANPTTNGRRYPQSLEVLYNKDAKYLQMHYVNHVSNNAALCSRLMWKVGDTQRIMASVGYKYSFGKHPGMGKQIVGEISSDGQIKQTITVPLLQNMLLKGYAEMNHFLSQNDLRQGSMPHKFGVTLNIHI